LAVLFQVDDDHLSRAGLAGGIALLIAAVPWLSYGWLVRRITTRRGIR
jgi:hypothetical protein